MQLSFSPINFCFAWTADNWYSWDAKEARSQARKARDAEAKRLVSQGKKVHKFTLPNQLLRRGGIGSGKPDVEFVCPVYYLNVEKA